MLLPVVSLLLTATPWQLSPEQVLLDVRTVGALGVGMRVALHGRRPSPLKPEETGAPRPVALGPGQRGTIVAFLQQTTTIAGLDSQVTYRLALVRWDAQTWYEWDIPFNRMQQGRAYGSDEINRMNRENGAPVALQAFEYPVALDLLQPLGPADRKAMKLEADRARAAQRALGPPTRVPCGPDLHTVPDSYILFARPGFTGPEIAQGLSARRGVLVRRVWADSLNVESQSVEPFINDTRLDRVLDNCR